MAETPAPPAPAGRLQAVVVTFHPEPRTLESNLAELAAQTDGVIVVDNTPGGALHLAETCARAGARLIANGDNLGIARAHNLGIRHARALGATHVLLMDQDSAPGPNMVAALWAAHDALTRQGRRVAAVGPRFMEEHRDDFPPFVRTCGLRTVRCPCPRPDAVVAVDHLISSGCLIPLAVLDAVGGMAEAMFIDYVDIEWGLRARRLGFQCYGVCAARMRHRIGGTPLRFLRRRLTSHDALRHYYLVRNRVWMYRQPGPPLAWKVADGWRLALMYGVHSLCARPRRDHFRMMSLGLWHGLRGRLGRLDRVRAK